MPETQLYPLCRQSAQHRSSGIPTVVQQVPGLLTATARPLFRKTKASLSFIRTFLQPHSIIFIDVHSTFHKFQVVASVSNTTGARGARFLALLHVGTSS
ncbi:hypothetical protein CYMTET_17114 [Cymbomonas tetramitiformis]|uniref:Uncharacterized protein n=1 Tax=Cymbomonas tetramitiformis TaxID=36881 RepID=A0AAE0GAS6_9CHLO|nr:hypothetical protein CYMTET_17114 [Cymbomonas tetramitiformis]